MKTGDAREFWHNAKDERVFNGINAITWRGDHVVFQLEPEEWTRFFAVPVGDLTGDAAEHGAGGEDAACSASVEPAPAATPISLTPQDGQIESFSFSADGRYLYYGTNATDIERRHLWRVPTRGGTPGTGHEGRGHRARRRCCCPRASTSRR